MRRKAKAVPEIKYTARTLRALAYEYLRYEHGCYAVAFERSPLGDKPDVVGLDKRRQMREIEIKISKADFNRDAHKPHRIKLMDKLQRQYPRVHNYLYYLVPSKLVNHVLENAPKHAGVLTPNALKLNPFTGLPTLSLLRQATRLHDQKLSVRDSIMMLRDVSGTMASLLRDDVKHQVQKKALEAQVIDLGGVVEKVKRKKITKATLKTIEKATKKSNALKADADDAIQRKSRKRKTGKAKTKTTSSKSKRTVKRKKKMSGTTTARHRRRSTVSRISV